MVVEIEDDLEGAGTPDPLGRVLRRVVFLPWGYLIRKTLPNPLLPLGPFPRRRLRPPSIRLVAESGMPAASMGQLHAQAIIPDRAAMLRAQKLPSRADVQLGTTFAAGRANGRARPSCSQRSSPHPDVSLCFRSIVHSDRFKFLYYVVIHKSLGNWHSPRYPPKHNGVAPPCSVSTLRSADRTENTGKYYGIVMVIGPELADAMSTTICP